MLAFKCRSEQLSTNETANRSAECLNPRNKVQQLIDEYGFEDLENTVALQGRASEQLIMRTAQKSLTTLEAMSYQVDEFIISCSFNTRDCDIKK